MVQQLKVLAILPGNLGLIPTPPREAHKQWSLTLVPGDLVPFSGLLGTKHKVMHVQAQIYRQNIHTHKQNIAKRKKKSRARHYGTHLLIPVKRQVDLHKLQASLVYIVPEHRELQELQSEALFKEKKKKKRKARWKAVKRDTAQPRAA